MFFTQNPIGSSATEDLQDNAISFDYAMNSPAALWQDRFGKQHKTVQQALKDVGFKPAGFDFVSGGTLGIGDRDKCVFYPTDGYWYSWNGKLPYVIPANSSPTPGGKKGWGVVPLLSTPFKRDMALNAVEYHIQQKLDTEYSFFEWGGKNNGLDITEKLNLAINDIYKLKQNIMSTDEIYSVTLKMESGVDYKILGQVIIPSGIILDFNGSRCIGPDDNAGNEVYDPSKKSMFSTGFYDETDAIVKSNIGSASEVTNRVIGAGIKALAVTNSNCVFNLENFQEMCFIDDIRFSNCSIGIKTKNSFYARYGNTARPLIFRNCSMAANQEAILLNGSAAHQLEMCARLVGCSIGIKINAANSFDVSITGSFEEGYNRNSIGILNQGSYCQAWRVNSYFEGVRVGITTSQSGTFYSCFFSPGYFSSCEYAFKAYESSFRKCKVLCTSAPDEGVNTRNIMDFSAPNNNVDVTVEPKRSITGNSIRVFPSNVLLGAGCKADGIAYHVQDGTEIHNTDVIAMAQPAMANQAELNIFPFEGNGSLAIPNQVPFCNLVSNVNTLEINTNITFNMTNILTFNFRGGTDTLTFVLTGFIFGDKIQWVERNPADVIGVITNENSKVRLTFNNLLAKVPIINTTGLIRHV